MKAGSIILSAFLAMAPITAQAQSFTIKISSPTVNDVTHEWMKAFKAGVETRSAGKVKVDIYPANQLGQIPATVEGVAMGTIEVVAPASGFLIGLEPRFQVFDAPGLFSSMSAAQKTFADPDIRKRFAEYGATKGLEPIAMLAHGPVMLLSGKTIRKVDDFKGQKIRVPGAAPLQIEPFRKLGASPLSMPLGEVLSAMQNHTIDGVVASSTVFTAFKYYDLAKGLTALPGSFLIVPAMANKEFLTSLGPQLQAVVREEAFNAQRSIEKFAQDDAAKTEQVWKQNGGELVSFNEAETKRYIDQVSTALPAVLNANPKLKSDYEALTAAAAANK
jgi:TRAP-type C4-dicarboxylate transport system substrate-binding protein